MANPLKVLTQLSASKEAQFKEVVEMQKTVTISGAEANLRITGGGEISGSGAFKAAGAAQLGSSLDVKDAASLSSSLGVIGAVDLQDILDVAGVANFASDVSASAGMDIGDVLHVVGAAQLDATLDVDGIASFASDISGAAGLDLSGSMYVGGAAELASTLDVADAANFASTLDVVGDFATQASASIAGDLDVDGDADVAGDLGVHGDAVIYGNLEVKGTMTTIESTTVTVADANIQLATVASPTDATADGAGITILGETNKTFQWNDDEHGFTSSENMNLAGGKVYKIDGQELLASDGTETILSQNNGPASVRVKYDAIDISGSVVNVERDFNVNEDMSVAGVASFQSDISGAAGLELLGAADIGATLDVAGVASFASDITASANVDVAGAVDADVLRASTAVVTPYIMNEEETVWIDTDGPALNIYADNIISISSVDAIRLNGAGGTQVTGSTDLGSTLAVAGVASFASDITASAGLDVAAAAHFADAVDMGATLNVDGVASFQSDISGAAGLEIAQGINISSDGFGAGQYKINDFTTVELNNGQARLVLNREDIALNNLYVGVANFGDGNGSVEIKSPGHVLIDSVNTKIALSAPSVEVSGAFGVTGETNLQSGLNVVGDAKFSADIIGGFGLVMAGDVSDPYNTATFKVAFGEVSSSLPLNIGGVATFANDVTASAGLDLAGAAHIAGAVDMDSTLNVDGAADFQDAAGFHANVAMDAALNLSGSEFVNISTPVNDGKYNVNDAIRALDAKAGQQASDINSNYAALRYLASGNFDAQGMKTFVSQFLIADIEKVTVDVLVKADGSSVWTNDLVSVQVKAGGAGNAYVAFEISAPAMGAADSVRIIAVKEQGDLA